MADGGIIISATADTSDVKKALESIETAAERTAKELDAIFAGINDDGSKKTLTEVETAIVSVGAVAKETKSDLDRIFEGLNNDGSRKAIQSTTEDVQKLRDTLDESLNKIQHGFEDFEFPSQASDAIEKAEDDLRHFGVAIRDFLPQISNFHQALRDGLNENTLENFDNLTESQYELVDAFNDSKLAIVQAQADLEDYDTTVIEVSDTVRQYQEETRKMQDRYEHFSALLREGLTAQEAEAIAYAETGDAASQATEEIKQNTQAVQSQTEAVKVLTPAQQEAADKAKKHQQEQEKLKHQLEITKAAILSYVSQAINKAISAMNSMVDATIGFRQEVAFLETNLESMGIDLEESSGYLEEFGVISSNVSDNVGSLSNLLQAGFEGEELSTAIEAVNGAVIAFPDQNVQRIGEGIQRTFGQGKAVGNFRELILRTGGDVEEFDRQMQSANTDAQKQQVILRELERQGLAPLVDIYRENNEALVEASEAQLKYNTAASDLGEALQPGRTALQEIQASILSVIARIAEANPEITKVAYVVLNIGAVLLTVVGAINLFKKTFGGLPSLFGNIGKSGKSAGKGVKELGNEVGEAGGKAKQANFEFISIAAGIALIAVGVAVAIVAVAELVKAFGNTNGDMIKTAAAIAIVVAAITVMIGALTLLFKLVKDDSQDFVIFSAAILIIAGAFSLMFVALANLVDKMNEGRGSFRELAAGITDIVTSITLSLAVIALLGKFVGNSAPQLLIFATAILVVAAAVFLLAAAFALLSGKKIEIPKVPTTSSILDNGRAGRAIPQLSTVGGYASGTQSAKRGYSWVDETTNPRMLWFNGGETVLTRAQTNAQLNARTSSGGGSGQRIYNIGNITIDAKNVKEFNDVVKIMENEKDSIRQGYIGG